MKNSHTVSLAVFYMHWLYLCQALSYVSREVEWSFVDKMLKSSSLEVTFDNRKACLYRVGVGRIGNVEKGFYI